MPRLSLWNKNKNSDYTFIDRNIKEMFYAGGTDIYVHKYVGVKGTTNSTDPTLPDYNGVTSVDNIQDLLFLENRDRKYDRDIYELRVVYNVSDRDFDLTQFGIFLTNDTIFMTFHINDTIDRLGRKLLAGDVLELPHLKDFYPLDSTVPVALRKFYVISDVTNAGEGFSPTWWPHLYRVKVGPLVDSQEYDDILDPDGTAGTGEEGNLKDILSNYNENMDINNAIIAKAEADAPESGYDTTKFYVVPTREDNTVAETNGVPDKPKANGWTAGYLTGDGLPPNGHSAGFGTEFPGSPTNGSYFLRTDFMPNRLFQWSGTRWVKIEDDVRVNLTNNTTRNTQKAGFFNNTNTFTVGNETVQGRQSLSQALKPKAD